MLRALALSSLMLTALALGGCSDQACIQWSEAEGACPAQGEAMAYMGGGGASCGLVISVDGEGDFDGTACCYDVTERDPDDAYDCVPGTVGAGPAVTVTSAAVSSSSSSSSGGFPTCVGDTCAPACFPPIESPFAGSCYSIDGVQSFCNPVTNEGCSSLETCDLFVDDFGVNFICYPASLYGTGCTFCSNWGDCSVGYGCFTECAKYCCDDIDCGDSSRCATEQLAGMGMPGGVCVVEPGTGGAGGQGGAGQGGAGGQGGVGGAFVSGAGGGI